MKEITGPSVSHYTRSSLAHEAPDLYDCEGPPAIAARLLRAYRERDKVFDGAFLGSPAWEAMLVLMVHPEGLSLDRICNELRVGAVVVEKWLNVLVGRGAVSANGLNGSRLYSLTTQGGLDLEKILLGLTGVSAA